ncbi:hypothetical protein CAOG_06561 [Capsaspora owczarzaki ATCC 30864]|uniref:Uncharacterized protein n=1 Tax=Capsaspora owczarzaki (strain ATCC 30864) TaxID=595528 RepID=A0A0D2X4K2_CAPO3|nr:hypothetical protein CAOG_06561 [Capsaspora owczarzaki ATCC 30864]KJE96204.1 hypothetical protein CAOG_006561 [Capsaspora owczarzaki ATCC 30864]|eukprot:XP_004345310.1 hypothetical protein CAOG_06561 [Capsaspora owczarzaki ATCC 30864]
MSLSSSSSSSTSKTPLLDLTGSWTSASLASSLIADTPNVETSPGSSSLSSLSNSRSGLDSSASSSSQPVLLLDRAADLVHSDQSTADSEVSDHEYLLPAADSSDDDHDDHDGSNSDQPKSLSSSLSSSWSRLGRSFTDSGAASASASITGGQANGGGVTAPVEVAAAARVAQTPPAPSQTEQPVVTDATPASVQTMQPKSHKRLRRSVNQTGRSPFKTQPQLQQPQQHGSRRASKRHTCNGCRCLAYIVAVILAGLVLWLIYDLTATNAALSDQLRQMTDTVEELRSRLSSTEQRLSGITEQLSSSPSVHFSTNLWSSVVDRTTSTFNTVKDQLASTVEHAGKRFGFGDKPSSLSKSPPKAKTQRQPAGEL